MKHWLSAWENEGLLQAAEFIGWVMKSRLTVRIHSKLQSIVMKRHDWWHPCLSIDWEHLKFAERPLQCNGNIRMWGSWSMLRFGCYFGCWLSSKGAYLRDEFLQTKLMVLKAWKSSYRVSSLSLRGSWLDWVIRVELPWLNLGGLTGDHMDTARMDIMYSPSWNMTRCATSKKVCSQASTMVSPNTFFPL